VKTDFPAIPRLLSLSLSFVVIGGVLCLLDDDSAISAINDNNSGS
jgi:hypothetical protein